jgi:hypothetical protein
MKSPEETALTRIPPENTGCNALNLGVEFFLLFSHQIQALLFSLSRSLAKP